jgi:hypothetical protein
VLERTEVPVALETLIELEILFDFTPAVMREIRNAGTARGGDSLANLRLEESFVLLH